MLELEPEVWLLLDDAVWEWLPGRCIWDHFEILPKRDIVSLGEVSDRSMVVRLTEIRVII